ncbi:MAG: hypothetical protein HYV13_03445 [Candidatus Doudnabacteria bacterium]|nr:hypothetical protein [Candidatus Doudnabacteria bacterium]
MKKPAKTSRITSEALERMLFDVPKKAVLNADFVRVKNQILSRIAVPAEAAVPQVSWVMALGAILPKILKIGGGVVGSTLIVSSLALGAAVTALDSVPGEPAYQFKKVVENIRLKLANDEDQARLQVKFAGERLQELEQILEQNKGRLGETETQEIVADTVQGLQQTTAAAVSASAKVKSTQPKVAILTTLVQQSALLKTAAIQSEGKVKVELEKALENNKISQEEAIDNIERAGLKVEADPIKVEEKPESEVKAYGKITALTETSISIGSSKFTISKDTKFVNTTFKDLKIGQVAEIEGQAVENKTFASTITAELKVKAETMEDSTGTEPQ